MSKAVILQHVAHEGPGRIVPVFRDFGMQTEVRRLDRGDEVPTDLDEIGILVVLGGPMGVADIGDSKYPFLAKEVETLKRLVAADRPVLGICLGAQLLAHAAGAKVHPNMTPGDAAAPAPEIGWAPVTFPFPGGTEPIVMGMIDGAPMFHWHFDTFELPKLPPPDRAAAQRPAAAEREFAAQLEQAMQEPGVSFQDQAVRVSVSHRARSPRHRRDRRGQPRSRLSRCWGPMVKRQSVRTPKSTIRATHGSGIGSWAISCSF